MELVPLLLLLVTATDSLLNADAADLLTSDQSDLHAIVSSIVQQQLAREKEQWRQDQLQWMREKQRKVIDLEKLQRLEVIKKWQEERKQWQEERKEWQEERKEWQEERKEWQEERKQWQEERKQWQEERKQWQEERKQWQEEKLQWQREREIFHADHRTLINEKQNLQLYIDSLLQNVNSTGQKLAAGLPIQQADSVHGERPLNYTPPADMSHGVNTLFSRKSARLQVRSDDANALEGVVAQLDQRVSQVGAEVQALKNTDAQHEQAIVEAGSTTFVRWGRSVCPNSTQLVYSGVVGGGYYSNPGSSTTVLCLPLNPVTTIQAQRPPLIALLFGAEYHTDNDEHYNQDAVCSVCRTPRSSTLLLPTTTVCPDGWTKEYSGYLMGSYPTDGAGHDFVCMDSAMEHRVAGERDENGLKFFYTYTKCGSLPCPPYTNDQLVNCAVCSK